jgi:hypothetical protein
VEKKARKVQEEDAPTEEQNKKRKKVEKRTKNPRMIDATFGASQVLVTNGQRCQLHQLS